MTLQIDVEGTRSQSQPPVRPAGRAGPSAR
jgi:hypothetical protein